MDLRQGLFPLLLLALAGCASHAEKKAATGAQPQRLAQAAEAWAQGDFAAAAAGYSEQLKESPAHPAALRGLGEAYLGMGEAQNALVVFEAALKLDPDDMNALEGHGLALIGLGRPHDAEPELRRVLAKLPRRWRTLDGLGLVADLNGDNKAAMGWYEAALGQRGDEPSIYNNYGYSRLQAHAYAHAEALFWRGLSLKAGLPRLRNNLLLAIAWQGDYARALAARNDIPLPVALNNIGYIALLREDREAAVKMFQQAMDASPVWYPQAAANLAAARQSPPKL